MGDCAVHAGEWVLTVEGARGLDRAAGEEYGIPSIVLMENAAIGAAGVALGMLEGKKRSVVVVCGVGNNGGDGFAVARHLVNAGVDVRVVLAGEVGKYAGDAALNLGIVRAMGVGIVGWDEIGELGAALVIDGLLGTGARLPLREPMVGLVDWVNRAREKGSLVLSLDVPTGMDADSGEVGERVVRADVTVTFAGLKAGFLCEGTERWTGRVEAVGIGVPLGLMERFGRRVDGYKK